jgi:hypothetical protein
MRDVFLAHAQADKPFAERLTDLFETCALVVGPPIALRGGERLLQLFDEELFETRYGVVIISRDFLRLGWKATVLDGLANRRRVVGLLWGVDELELAVCSRRLAVVAIPGGMAEGLVRMMCDRASV